MVGTNASTNEKHKFYNSTVQAFSRGEIYCATKVGTLCARFVDIGAPYKTPVENGLSKLLYFRGQTIDVSDQAFFTLNYFILRDEEEKEIHVSDLLTAPQRLSGCFCRS